MFCFLPIQNNILDNANCRFCKVIRVMTSQEETLACPDAPLVSPLEQLAEVAA